ncbi:hypothetical protein [Blastococcus sp. SYSU DS1024]
MRRAKPENMVQADIYALHLVGDDPLDDELRRNIGHCTRPDSLDRRLREHLGLAHRGDHRPTYTWIRQVGEGRVTKPLEDLLLGGQEGAQIDWWERSPNALDDRPR